ncbi:protein P21-like [Olea europaea var. sylvestris]|uniref:protein P21-like n=1 Tax=Olea europaea var. sylvestris TaxID=158386 RepID=UPI000C1CF316|nr:protein P21-like [Olea europaea var. sylvestris]
MSFFKSFFAIFMPLLFIHSYGIMITVQNNCPYTVWPAAVSGKAVAGQGRRLDSGQTWTLLYPSTKLVKIWARTNCTFNSSGKGNCLTGDCGGLLECKELGASPVTVAEYGLNDFARKDYYDISVMHGFNVPISLTPTSNGCTKSIRCARDLTAECPNVLRTPGGCHNPCTVYKTNEYCCGVGRCQPTDLSRFFKIRCKDAFTYPEDDPTSTFTCPPGTNYRVEFCP